MRPARRGPARLSRFSLSSTARLLIVNGPVELLDGQTMIMAPFARTAYAGISFS